jgi:hypothetical protein
MHIFSTAKLRGHPKVQRPQTEKSQKVTFPSKKGNQSEKELVKRLLHLKNRVQKGPALSQALFVKKKKQEG